MRAPRALSESAHKKTASVVDSSADGIANALPRRQPNSYRPQRGRLTPGLPAIARERKKNARL
jgi:hypothetical protein